MANRERLEKALDAVELAAALEVETGEQLRESWDQSRWCVLTECGTAMCIAGWACHQAGDRFIFSRGGVGADAERVIRADTGEIQDVEWRAMDLLDLTYGQAMDLFQGSNSLARVRELVARILAAEGD